jgi:DNA-binding response OmpR family regulator
MKTLSVRRPRDLLASGRRPYLDSAVPLSLGKITLRPAELKILTYLKEQPLRVVSAQELVSRVLETHGCGASVRNHVLQIRKAFRAGDAPDPILTVRGVGYRFRT